ncbi:hypothetical protein BT69DRAFT_1260344 [Atractiella rhizophila]|nr:hypothetical protein BT69DRAFT_1260344 [Atractiella rhizophila]
MNSDDITLPICQTCGTQVPSTYDISSCYICTDGRQFVGNRGKQVWTTWTEYESRNITHDLVPDEWDPRIVRVIASQRVAIGQTPIIVKGKTGTIIWDCTSYISLPTLQKIKEEYPNLLGIFISHPHFFSSSVTIARYLGCKVYISKVDQEWFARKDAVGDVVQLVEEQYWKVNDEFTMVRCGGHFPGSSVMLWDRSKCPSESLPHSGIIFVGDTVMVCPNLQQLSFMWSYPNMLPLPPKEVHGVWRALSRIDFEAIYVAWPGTELLDGGKEDCL